MTKKQAGASIRLQNAYLHAVESLEILYGKNDAMKIYTSFDRAEVVAFAARDLSNFILGLQ